MMISRRRFMAVAAACSSPIAFRTMYGRQEGAGPGLSRLAHDAERPQFHLLPAHNWMNDPNGPIFFKGRYHMFFQYNPKAAVWGNMSWNHAVSPDLLHWTHEPLALTEDPGGPDAAGCFSGSCVAVEEEGGHARVYAIYTGVVEDKKHPTIKAEGLKETQCLAWSDDTMLRTWTKQATPLLANPPADLEVTGFRDPSVWKEGNWYFMTVGSGMPGVGGCVLLYRSQDLRQWEYLHILTSGKGTGKTAENPVANGDMWECPDFFALDGGHVLIYSAMGKVYWQSGSLDRTTMKFTASRTGLLDLDAFYAPKTQLDAAGRRVLWGWIPERRSKAAMTQAGWSGMMSLPRIMNLDPDGLLRVQILPEVRSLRGSKIAVTRASGNVFTGALPNASGEVLCGTEQRAADFSLDVRSGSTSLLQIGYHAQTHTIQVDGHAIQLEESDSPSVHAFVDGSVMEVILGQRIGYTKRFYLGSVAAPALGVHASGTSLQLWNVMPISPDRLTSRATKNDAST